MKKALVVGINKYPDAPLRGCVNDAQAFSSLIERNEDYSLNFDVMLQTDLQRKNALMELIVQLFSGQSETALLYFSGHGYMNELGGYLVTPDHRRYDEGIAMNDIITLANSSPATNKIIILDCCHSGAIAAPVLAPGSPGHINEGITILTASRKEEVAMETRGRGIFTNLLLQALEGGAADISGTITPAGIYTYIDQALGPWEQRPVFKTNVSRFTPIRRVQPRIPAGIMKDITSLFPASDTEHQLDPSYESTNDPRVGHRYVAPFSNDAHTAVFSTLQKMQAAGLVEPVGEKHMYDAAMNSKTCRLTALGAHYWRLVNEKKI